MGRSESPDDRWRDRVRDRDRDRDRDIRRDKDSKSRRDKKSKRSRRDRSRSRSYSRSRSRTRSRSRSRERKRRRASPSPPPRPAADAGASRDAERQKEQEALEEEIEKRRRRAEAWQAQRRKLEHEGAATGDGSGAEAAQQAQQAEDEAGPSQAGVSERKWNLEDEGGLSDEEGAGGSGEPAPAPAPPAAVVPPPPLVKPGALKKQEEEEEVDPLDAFMAANAAEAAKAAPAAAPPPPVAPAPHDDDDVDPLDAFMAANVLPDVAKPAVNGNSRPASATASQPAKRRARRRNRAYASSSDDDYASEGGEGGKASSDEDDDETWARKVQAGKLSKGDKLGVTDHSTINYPPFRRNFYIEVPELARMTPAQVDAYRKSLDGVKVRGRDVPKPIKNWNQCGLSARVLDTVKRLGFERPLPIQAQALPVIMGGRDCIGIAKTGSGKTLAFVLPLIRHAKDQPALVPGDGPIGLIMAPTRELVTQIGREVKRFARAAGLECTCVYGGSGVANQISELKRGSEIVACTPGRMIDILATGAGKITNLRRVTYLVLDEADRMFDMGFEPQIMRIVNNVRPDRQTVLFSATFPRTVETLARKTLHNPVEIQVGGRSVVNSDITQYVEIRAPEDRFLRLLELLGEWYEKGKALIFVGSQDRCDALFRDLLRSGYPCLSLHGGKDQSDRESTIADFKSAVCNVLVATSVAARGLDVKDLVLVINYDCPNHHEDYVHRVGRTGRAGAKGTAVTFIAPDEEQFAPDLVKALKESGAPIPGDLTVMAEAFDRKKKAGLARAHGSGFGGSGYKFDAAEDAAVKASKKAAAKEFGMVESDSEEEGEEGGGEGEEGEGAEDDGVRLAGAGPRGGEAAPAVDVATLSVDLQARVKAAQSIAEKFTAQAAAAAAPPVPVAPAMPQLLTAAAASASGPSMLAAAQAAAQRLAAQLGAAPNAQRPAAPAAPVAPNIAAAAAAALQAMGVTPAAALAGAVPGTAAAAAAAAPTRREHFETELEINDFPQQARWKVTHRETLREINEQLGAAIVVKGRYVKPGDRLPEGERKLYLHIAGPSADIVRRAKGDIKRLLEESTEKAMRSAGPGGGRYSVM